MHRYPFFAELATKPGVVRLILALFLTGTLLAGFTRITIAGLFGSVSIAFFLRLKGFARVALPVLGVLGFIALFTLVGQFRERMFLNRADQFSFTTVLEDPSRAVEAIGGSGRYLAWNIAFNRLFKPNPLLGSGVGSAQLMFVDQGGAQISAVHSEVLRLLCDVGIVGFALYVLAWVQLFWLTRRRLRESQNGPLRTVATAAMAAGTAYLIFMLTDNGFDYVSQIGVFVYGLIGATIGSRAEPTRGARPETERKPAEPEKKPAPAELARSRPRQ